MRLGNGDLCSLISGSTGPANFADQLSQPLPFRHLPAMPQPTIPFAPLLPLVVALALTGCGRNPPLHRGGAMDARGLGPIPFEQTDDNVRHDTLLVQVTLDLKDGSFVMAASHRDTRFEGLRLYRYRPLSDSSADILAISSPAYDSWTMLPTFFAVDSVRKDGLWILANFGERESWGQKLMRLDSAFGDHGFIDVALPERVSDDGRTVLKRRNVAPLARFEFVGDSIWIRFACDSVFLYDDQRGGFDRILPGGAVRFLHCPAEGLSLWLHDEKRLVKDPV